jgi:hypothetical protein
MDLQWILSVENPNPGVGVCLSLAVSVFAHTHARPPSRLSGEPGGGPRSPVHRLHPIDGRRRPHRKPRPPIPLPVPPPSTSSFPIASPRLAAPARPPSSLPLHSTPSSHPEASPCLPPQPLCKPACLPPPRRTGCARGRRRPHTRHGVVAAAARPLLPRRAGGARRRGRGGTAPRRGGRPGQARLLLPRRIRHVGGCREVPSHPLLPPVTIFFPLPLLCCYAFVR